MNTDETGCNGSRDDQSEAMILLRSTVVPTCIFMVAGIVAMITGIISTVVVYQRKELRNKFFLLLTAMFVNDSLMGVAYVGTATKRFVRFSASMTETSTKWSCCCESMVLYFSQTLGLYLVLTLVLDRLISIVAPLRYKFITSRQLTCPLVTVSACLAILETSIMLIEGSSEKGTVPLCGTADCWPRSSYIITLVAHLVISFLVVFLNILMIFVVRNANESPAQQHGWLGHMRNNLQMKVMKTLLVMVASHGTSHISTRLGLMILFFQTGEDPEITVIGLILRNLVVINAASHFFIYYITSSEFRTGVHYLFKKFTNSNSVTPS